MNPSLLLLLWPSIAGAADLLVGPLQVYPTINDALAVAAAGDRILVDPGTYIEDVDLNVPVELIGVGGSGATTLSVGAGSHLLYAVTGSTATVSGFTLDAGGQRRCLAVSGTTLVATDIVTRNCAGAGDGGAVLVESGGRLELSDSDLSDPASATGEGGQIAVISGSLLVERTAIANGSAAGRGGAVYGSGSALELYDTSFDDNDAVYGGAIYATGGSILVVRGSFSGNSATLHGGSVRGWAGAPVDIVDSTFIGGSAGDTGGHVAVVDGDLYVSGSRFDGASADEGGALYAENSLRVDVIDSAVVENTAVIDGGGLLLDAVPEFLVSGSTFCGNAVTDVGGDGGGIAMINAGSPTSVIETSVFVDNVVIDEGGAVDQSGSGELLFLNNHVLGNSQAADAGMLHFSYTSTTVNSLVAHSDSLGLVRKNPQQGVEYGLFFDNALGDSSHALSATNVTGTDPALVLYTPGDCDDDDLHPEVGSPLVDAGDPTLSDPDGSRSDIGAFGGPNADPDLFVDNDGDGYDALFDCDDADALVNPAATEVALDGIDQDCDGGDLCYLDGDGDGHGRNTLVSGAPGCDAPGVSWTADDCDDAAADRYPGAVETCDGVDNDCDGSVDEYVTYFDVYRDADADGYGDPAAVTSDCTVAAGWSLDATDCDDGSAAIHPGAAETTADGVDQDCDGGDQCYVDGDGDGIGGTGTTAGADLTCTGAGESTRSDDCDDASAAVYPGAGEQCGGVDEDCDGLLDDLDPDLDPASALSGFVDGDGDGYGDGAAPTYACALGGAVVADGTDCDDTDPTAYPGAPEAAADGVDADCDGVELCYEDLDGDGYGSFVIVPGALACDGPGQSPSGADCDDTDAGIHPGAVEIPGDGIDQNCDALDTGAPTGPVGTGLPADTGPDTDTGLPTGPTTETGGPVDTAPPGGTPGTPTVPGDTDADSGLGALDTAVGRSPQRAEPVPRGWFCATTGGGLPPGLALLLGLVLVRRRR